MRPGRPQAFPERQSVAPKVNASNTKSANLRLNAENAIITARAKRGRVAPPPPEEPLTEGGQAAGPPRDGIIEEAYKRGKVASDMASDLARLKQRASTFVRETFVTQHQIKGTRPATTDGKTWTRFFAPAIDRIRVLHSATRNARAQAQGATAAIFDRLTGPEYDAMNYYLYVRDAYEDLIRGVQTRPGFSLDGAQGNVLTELQKAQERLDNLPQAKEAADSYLRMMRAARDAAETTGLLKSTDQRDYYYPHNMVDYIRDNTQRSVGAGKLRVKIPKALSRRMGSMRDISTNLIDNTEKYLTDLFTSLKTMETLHEIGSTGDIRNNPDMVAKDGTKVQYTEGQIPPDYTEWSPTTGFARFRHGSVAERLLGQMLDIGSFDDLAKHYGVDVASFRDLTQSLGLDDAKVAIAKLGASQMKVDPGKTYIIPKELARALDEAVIQSNKTQVQGLGEKFTRTWKSAVLNLAPIRYNFRNMVGDVQRMYTQFGTNIADPSLWSAVGQSVHDYYVNKRIDPRMQQMLDLAVSSSGRTQSELPMTLVDPRLRLLEHGADTSPLKQAMILAHKAISIFPEASSAREDIVRGVIMEMNNRRMAAGKEPLMGVADPELVKGLLDNKEYDRAAAYIARKSLIDYGDFTPRENAWRAGVLPFYAWLRGNFQFWATVGKDIGSGNAIRASGSMARGSSMAMLSGAAGMAAVLGAVRVWNETVAGKYEESLPEHLRKTTHFIVPDIDEWQRTGEFRPAMDEQGNVKVWALPDALDDFFTYLGLDHLIPEMWSVHRGTLSQQEMQQRLKEYAGVGKGAARTFFGQLSPLIQFPTQVIAGKRLFPDPLHPTDIPPEQRASALRDVLGIGSTGLDQVLDAGIPGRNIYQPATHFWDVGKQLGYQTVNEPSIMQEGQFKTGQVNYTQYEVDLIKQIKGLQAEIADLKGRGKREYGTVSNRQLDPDNREKNLQTRIAIITEEKVRQIQDLDRRLTDLQRFRRLHPNSP